MNTARKKNRLLSFLLALVMIFGMLPLASLLPTRVAAASYPSSLNKLVEGKKIYEGYRYRFYSNGTVESYTYSIDPEYTNYSAQALRYGFFRIKELSEFENEKNLYAEQI